MKFSDASEQLEMDTSRGVDGDGHKHSLIDMDNRETADNYKKTEAHH